MNIYLTKPRTYQKFIRLTSRYVYRRKLNLNFKRFEMNILSTAPCKIFHLKIKKNYVEIFFSKINYLFIAKKKQFIFQA